MAFMLTSCLTYLLVTYIQYVMYVLWIVAFAWFEHWLWLWISSVHLTWQCFDCRRPVYLIYTHWFWWMVFAFEKGSLWVRPVNRGCLLLLSTWPHLWYIQMSVFALFSDLYFLQVLWDWLLVFIHGIYSRPHN
jgi:hypothetical protein